MVNIQSEHEFEGFSTRTNFNKNLGHFRIVTQLVKDIEAGKNPGDLIQVLLSNGSLSPTQILPIAQSILIQKYQYETVSFNLKEATTSAADLAAELIQWCGLDLVLTYFHPESGVTMINPKNVDHWKSLGEFKKHELVTVYLGGGAKTAQLKLTKEFQSAIQAGIKVIPDLLSGIKIKTPASVLKGSFVWKAERKAPAEKAPKVAKQVVTKGKASKAKTSASDVIISVPQGVSVPAPVQRATPEHLIVRQVASAGGRMNVSPKIGIQVTNELFHNGNVEAWKRIIESYSVKYANYRVTVYYEGEMIHDINSLFKWGKVKHGTSIFFAVAGPDEKINDLSKLRKYLFEGASPRYESFLRGTPGKILELF